MSTNVSNMNMKISVCIAVYEYQASMMSFINDTREAKSYGALCSKWVFLWEFVLSFPFSFNFGLSFIFVLLMFLYLDSSFLRITCASSVLCVCRDRSSNEKHGNIIFNRLHDSAYCPTSFCIFMGYFSHIAITCSTHHLFFTSYSCHSSTLDTSLLVMEYHILTGLSVV